MFEIYFLLGSYMKIKSRIDYILVLKYFSLFILSALFSMLKGVPSLYSVGVFTSAVALGFNPFSTAITLVLSIIVVGGDKLLLFTLPPIAFFCLIWGVYKVKKRKMGLEITLYTLLTLALFIVMGQPIPFTERIFDTVICALISMVLVVSGKAIIKKGFKYKFSYEETFTIFLSVLLLGLGVSNLLSPFAWKGVSIFLILCISFTYKSGKSLLTSVVLGLSLAVYYKNVNFVSLYLIIAIAVQSLMPVSRFLSAISVIAVDYVCYSFLGVLGSYEILNALSTSVGVLIFCSIPKRVLGALKNRINLFRDKQLTRMSINRLRLMTSNRLFELSAVFLEIADSYLALSTLDEKNGTATSLLNRATESVCVNCRLKDKCIIRPQKKSELLSMIEIGLAKGKLSFIDVPKDLSSCVKLSDLIYALNKFILEEKDRALKKMDRDTNRKVLSGGARGVAEILKGLGCEYGTQLKYQSALEKTLSESLYRSGYIVSELMVYGDKDLQSISLIITGKEFSIPQIKSVIESVLKTNLNLSEKCFITDEKCYLEFKKSATYDAVFGLTALKKDGSSISGDTHSVSRIQGDKFLVALSDGMGSGEDAQKVSSTSLSLIESFYKASLPSPLILSTVNKLLVGSSSEIFTALDVAVVDLKNCKADFIKFGAPYGFIISENSVRIVESSSLPLGVLDDFTPKPSTADLIDGDLILMMTDGVSDSFSSSADLLEFLRTLPAKNPQTLTDEVMRKALELSNGLKKDDMTALAVRIFRKEEDYAV